MIILAIVKVSLRIAQIRRPDISIAMGIAKFFNYGLPGGASIATIEPITGRKWAGSSDANYYKFAQFTTAHPKFTHSFSNPSIFGYF